SISFINRNEGWVAVDYQESSTSVYPAILKTTDSGNTWTVIPVSLGSSINEIDFTDSSLGYLETIDGNLYKSTDGGNNWDQISNIQEYNILYMEDGLVGWAIGSGVGKTSDGGITWTKLISGNYWDAVFYNANYGWILGKDSLNQNATFYTIDGGLNWVRKSFDVQSNNLFIDFIDEQIGWILFEDGTLMKTINSGITFVKEDKFPTVTQYSLSQNYPNPFNPSTKISWQSPVSSWQTLKVFDVLGKEVAVLVNEEKSSGSYEINFDASKLSSGVYYYQLSAGVFIQTKKMILLK
ncbi:MAG TPA: T9SS type A sorting domain-containing protein, partial [Ignavibacteriaceae bacterium]|nr:T9SS type A sorting domain-containing protein [Ignavibacteriaceae bacterium]